MPKFEPGKSGNPRRQFTPGISGNPAGKSKIRRRFEEALADALGGENPAERAKELAELVWTAARKGEAWAVQLLMQRLAPEPIKVKMEVSRGADEFDFSRLSDEQIEQLERIFEQIAGPAGFIEAGEGAAPPP
jgi:Family of unknown function (DUF5681)